VLIFFQHPDLTGDTLFASWATASRSTAMLMGISDINLVSAGTEFCNQLPEK